ncbi:MAG: tRNA (adenosine(37)-N6)-dimethylallyltransferase MiaA [Nitrospira sp.]|nr:tRNA (adenosine(37)-N6)-dimethylallyltransferase MiaA [Nitrospira sp.]
MNKVIVLLGPTGVGKTGVSILLAKVLNTEIISADSMQVYKYMNIGTAKPTPEERAAITHHMIDIVDPWESYSTGKYIEAVVPIIENVHKKGKIPLIVGGTGLYIKAMTRGIFSGPSADWTLRKELLSMEEEEKRSLYNYLKELDPDVAEKITTNDTRRIIRALEVCLKSNKSMSEMQKKFTKPLPYEFVKIGLQRERKELYRMIESRVDEMINIGLVEEVKNILKMNPDRTPMQAIGYKEIAMYLHGGITIDEAIKLIKKGSKRYAKRQLTWFNKEKSIHWIDITGIHDNTVILDLISDVLS